MSEPQAASNADGRGLPVEARIAQDSALGLFQKVLLATDGTVTELIRLYTGEAIRARKIDQETVAAPRPAALQAAPQARLLRRRILLCGPHRSYMYAESLYVLDRLPRTVRDGLMQTEQPIGLLWRRERMETYREIVDYRVESDPVVAAFLGVPDDTRLLARTYLVFHEREPLGMITEKFPGSYFRDRTP